VTSFPLKWEKCKYFNNYVPDYYDVNNA